jgi:UDP-hydrolysing UDP-N-acetyl-D-glucosamine 2-epimerase
MTPRRIAVVTGTRAEYGLLRPLLFALQQRTDCALQLIVTGAHLSPAHGMTLRDIEADGLPIHAKIDIGLSGDSPHDIAQATAHCLARMSDQFTTSRPDLVVVLGDRYEIFAAAAAATLLTIPVAHLHGGETTVGAIDESLRHAITKLSYWHFVSCDAYGKRVAQLGEAPERIFTYGAPGLDNMVQHPTSTRAELETTLAAPLGSPLLLLTYHPQTYAEASPLAQLDEALAALQQFPEVTLVISGANADAGGHAINQRLSEFAAQHPRSIFRLSYPSALYINLMRHCDLVIGNSSSGVIEAPALGKASVNIGDRQKGRLRAASVIDTSCERAAIATAIRHALSADFQKTLTPSGQFGTPGTISVRIAEQLATAPLPATPAKAFYDC